MSIRQDEDSYIRALHYIFIADCSGSMRGDGKIQALNATIREAIPHMQDAAKENPSVGVFVRCIKFSSGAQWCASQPTQVDNFTWTDLQANGVTDMGKALVMVAGQLKIPPMSDQSLPPVLVLISDGQPSDNFDDGLKVLMGEPLGRKAIRIAVAIGKDANHEVLQKFIGTPELKPLLANNPDALFNNIKWVVTAVLKSASSLAKRSIDNSNQANYLPIPAPPTNNGPNVW